MSPLSGERYSEVRPASADLSDRFRERIRLFALRRVRDAALAEDLAQETLRRVSDALAENRLENPDALPAFVFQTARHLCLQRGRSAARESRALSRWGAEQREASDADALLVLLSEERRAAVRGAVGALEPADRRLLELLYWEDAPTAEVAARLGITPETLRVRKHRALRRLAGLLGEPARDVTP